MFQVSHFSTLAQTLLFFRSPKLRYLFFCRSRKRAFIAEHSRRGQQHKTQARFCRPADTVQIPRRGHTPGSFVISVKDNGIGIPSDKQHIIFERFAQVDDTLTKRSEGCGLGLSLVKSLVELHGGRVWVESRPGLGSKLSFELPARKVDTDDSQRFGPDITDRIYYEFSDLQ